MAIFFVIAIILMLVLLEKNTGGKDGGIGCVSGAVLFGIFLLVMTRSQELKNQGQPNPISSIEGVLNALPTLLAWLLGIILTSCVLGGLGYLAYRAVQKESGRRTDRDTWMNMLAPLTDAEFDAMASNYKSEINAAFRSEDWLELRRRRCGQGPVILQPDRPGDWERWVDLARWSPLILMALALLWQLGSGMVRHSDGRANAAAAPVGPTETRIETANPKAAESPADWMERYEVSHSNRP